MPALFARLPRNKCMTAGQQSCSWPGRLQRTAAASFNTASCTHLHSSACLHHTSCEPSGATEVLRPDSMPGSEFGGKTFLLIWADTAEPVRLTPSVLLAHLILCSRRVCPQPCLHMFDHPVQECGTASAVTYMAEWLFELSHSATPTCKVSCCVCAI